MSQNCVNTSCCLIVLFQRLVWLHTICLPHSRQREYKVMHLPWPSVLYHLANQQRHFIKQFQCTVVFSQSICMSNFVFLHHA